VEIDQTWVNMPDYFPSTPRKRGSGYVITLRIPRFNSTMFYDPIMSAVHEEPEFEESPDPNDGGTATCSTFVPLCAGLLLAFAATKFTLSNNVNLGIRVEMHGFKVFLQLFEMEVGLYRVLRSFVTINT